MNQHSPQENKMGTMPIGKLLINMALPMIISMLVQALYNVVDSIYVSQISESAVTALSLAFPIQNMLIGVAVGVGVGINSVLSKYLGEQNFEGANKTAGNGAILMVLGAVIFVLFGIFGVRPYFEIQSTVAETVEGGTVYTSICCVLSMGVFLQILCERLLQSTGRTVYTMYTQAFGAIINIILDPILIHGWFGFPALGIAGAAWATVIGQWSGAFLGIWLNLKHNPELRFGVKYVKPDGRIIKAILAVGIPAIIMNGIGSVMNFGMNQILQSFTETATGVFGIYFKLQSFFFMPLFGINGATISIIAYNYGARKPERIMSTLKTAGGVSVAFMTAGLLIFQLMPDLLLNMFNPSEEFLMMGRSALRSISWCFPVAAICIMLGSCFQAMGDGMYSTAVSLCRQLLVLLPAAYLLSLSGNVNAVWLSFPIAEFASTAVTLYFFIRVYRRKIKPMFEQ